MGAIRDGKQWRIPYPNNIWHWEISVRRRFKDLGAELKPSWKRELEALGKEFARYELESYRLWLAAYLKAVSRGPITYKGITEILLLWQAACQILALQPKGTEVGKLKSQFPGQLGSLNISSAKIRSIMSRWPGENCFQKVHAARTLKQLEQLRRAVDVAQAAKACEERGEQPTGPNLCPRLHKNFMMHINDTREELPGHVIDLRKTQKGLPLRSFRARHPLRKVPQKTIIAETYRHNAEYPGPGEKSEKVETPSEPHILDHREN